MPSKSKRRKTKVKKTKVKTKQKAKKVKVKTVKQSEATIRNLANLLIYVAIFLLFFQSIATIMLKEKIASETINKLEQGNELNQLLERLKIDDKSQLYDMLNKSLFGLAVAWIVLGFMLVIALARAKKDISYWKMLVAISVLILISLRFVEAVFCFASAMMYKKLGQDYAQHTRKKIKK